MGFRVVCFVLHFHSFHCHYWSLFLLGVLMVKQRILVGSKFIFEFTEFGVKSGKKKKGLFFFNPEIVCILLIMVFLYTKFLHS